MAIALCLCQYNVLTMLLDYADCKRVPQRLVHVSNLTLVVRHRNNAIARKQTPTIMVIESSSEVAPDC